MHHRRKKRELPQNRMAYRIDDAAHVVGLSRSSLYKDIREKKLPIMKRNRSTFVLHDDLYAYLQSFTRVA